MAEIKVTVTPHKSQGVTVSSQQLQNDISASGDTGRFWAQTAKNWAVSENIVDGEDYSSKYYANQTKTQAERVHIAYNSVNDTYNQFVKDAGGYIEEVLEAKEVSKEEISMAASDGLLDIRTAKEEAVDNIATVKDESIASVEAKSNEVLSSVNTGLTNINTAKTDAVNAVTTTKNSAVTEINNKVSDGKQELNDIIAGGGLNINDKLTNCLLEVPQNIKLELNNGTLTLKVGSKVIVPNGFEADGTTKKFDYVTITSDISVTNTNTGGASFVYYTESYGNPSLVFSTIGSTISGASIQATHTIYNTSINKVNYLNGNSEVQDERSLPIAIVQRTGVISSIDQVFNGMGYIGSTIWVDKGVKGLAPNGRNEDGSLNNIEFTTDKVLTREIGVTGTNINIFYNCNSDVIGFAGGVSWEFDKEKNSWRFISTGVYYPMCVLGTFDYNSSIISNFQSKFPFRAVDYNDAVLKDSLQECQVVVETYVSGTSGYRIWSDNFKEQWGYAYGGTFFTFLKPFSNNNYSVTLGPHKTGGNLSKYGTFVETKNNTGFTMNNNHNDSKNAWFYACGY